MFSKYINKYKAIPIQIKASFWFLICAFLQKGVSFITTPIFTRLLSTAEYGQYNVFTSWMSILTVIVTLNLFYGVYTRGLVIYKEEREEYSSALQGLTSVLILAWLIIYLIFHELINRIIGLTTYQMIIMIVMMWTTSVFNFWSSKQRVDFKYRALVLITIFVSIAKPLLGIILVKSATDKVNARIFGLFIVELVAFTFFFFEQMYKGKKFFVKRYWLHALSFNIPLIPHYLSTSILNSADRIMIEKISGESQVGIYSLAYSLSMIMTMLNNALLQTIEPWMYQKIKEDKIEEISKVAYPCFGMVALLNLFLIAFAPEAISLFAPSSYHEAIYVIPPVTMSVFFMFSYTFFAVFEFYYKRTKQIALATTIGAVLNIILNYIFIHLYGYIAAGYTTLLCYVIYAVAHYIFMKKICKEELNGRQAYSTKIYLLIAISFVLVGSVFLLSYNNTLLRFSLIIIAFVMTILFRKKLISTLLTLVKLKKK